MAAMGRGNQAARGGIMFSDGRNCFGAMNQSIPQTAIAHAHPFPA